MSHTLKIRKSYTTLVSYTIGHVIYNSYIVYALGVFTDVVNLVFRDDSAEVSGDASKETDSAKTLQRELITSKCLQFLRLLARYVNFNLVFSSIKNDLCIAQKEQCDSKTPF